MSSEHRFGYEWGKYASLTEVYEDQFINWTKGIEKEDWKGKRILDAGCGMGRNSYWPMKWGAHSVIAFDYDKRSVASTRKTLEKFQNAEVLFRSVYDIDWKDTFDIAFSIGVIHHLVDPKQALLNIVSAIKPEGQLLVWVYSYEGNEWIVRYVNPIRKLLTSKLPPGIVHMLSYFCSVPLYLFVKFFRNQNKYLTQLSTFDFWHIHSIVFDQLIPDVANYWKREEVLALVEGLSLINVSVTAPLNNSGWILRGTKQ